MDPENEQSMWQRYESYMSRLHACLQQPPPSPAPRPCIDAYRTQFVHKAVRVERESMARINRRLKEQNHEGKMALTAPDYPLEWHKQFVRPRYSRHAYRDGEPKHTRREESLCVVSLEQAMNRFLDATRHVSYAEFQAQLHICFDEILREAARCAVQTLYLPMPSYDRHLQDISVTTRKSNFWVAQHLQQYLQRRGSGLSLAITFGSEGPYFEALHQVQSTTTRDLYVVLDDAAYTGNQLMDNALGCLTDWVRHDDVVFVAVPFLSVEAESNITRFMNAYLPARSMVASHETFAPLSQEMPPHAMARLIRFRYGAFVAPEPAGARVRKDCSKQCALYFDHKTPDYMSGFPDLYSGVLPVVGNEGEPDAAHGSCRCRWYPFVLNADGSVQAAVVDTADARPVPPYKKP
jgi:hypothetical protein